MHYAGFAEMVEIAKAKFYRRTQKFAPNWMLIAPEILPVLTFIPGFTASSTSNIAGPYMAGTLNGMKVYVSPMLQAQAPVGATFVGSPFILGLNGSDLQSSCGVYAPYMPIVPTQLLGFADGAMSQGWSTLYDLHLLSTYGANGAEADWDYNAWRAGAYETAPVYSRLLIKGVVTA